MRHSALFAAALPVAFAASVADWRARSIYQIVTDRFATTNHSVATCDPQALKYCGGTWQGIAKHLDYIQNMGFDAILISPVVANLEEETTHGYAYHGYWTQDLNALNSHFGSANDLKALSKSVHDRDMYLMVDVLVNHLAAVPSTPSPPKHNATTADKADTPDFDFESMSPLSSKGAFHPHCFITDHTNQTQVEQCWLGDVHLGLPDIDTENMTNFRMLNSWITDLVEDYKIDGLRISSARYIRKSFWQDFKTAAGVFCLGEVSSDNVTYTSDYTQVLDGVLDYPTWFALSEVFSGTTANFSKLIDTVTRSQENYQTGLMTSGSFVESESQPRLPSLTQDASLIKNAVTWPFLHDGIPILYYGQEQGFSGGVAPGNHEALWPTQYKTYHKPLMEHISALNAARGLAIKAGEGFLTSPMKFIPQEYENALVVSKRPLLGLLTNAGNVSMAPTTWTIPARQKLFLKGESLVDVLTCMTYEVDPVTGDLTVQSAYGLPVVILPTRLLEAGGTLCPASAPPSDDSRMASIEPWHIFTSIILLFFHLICTFGSIL
ncbi:GH13 alpha-amylase precursor [Mucidula mucida]|nr:GH13 alpha-amylase precursor [Mucidula mucida]